MGASFLNYYGYRWYDPNFQRWPNKDPIGEAGGINLYEFVRNQPTIRRDSFGLYGLPGSVDCAGLLRQIEQLESDIAAAAREGQDDPAMYAKLAALNAQYTSILQIALIHHRHRNRHQNSVR